MQTEVEHDGFVRKHRKLASLVCCPNCHNILTYPGGDFHLGVPLASRINCSECGDVGWVSNLKYQFTPESVPHIEPTGSDYSGTLKVDALPMSPKYFGDPELWHFENDRCWSATGGANFLVESDSLAIGFVFLKHPWAGKCQIRLDGRVIVELDLFEEAGSMEMWYPIHLGGGSHVIELEVAGSKHMDSNDSQVHLVGFEKLELTETTESKIIYPARNTGNPYPARFEELMEDVDMEGVILDCGSGDRNHSDARVINFEYSRFRSPDIFGDGHTLPFKTDSFDLILSQAVIEHLYEPAIAVQEILRVLKPGGVIYAESAFMQPLHAVPFHFFNTTTWGLEYLFRSFEILDLGHEGRLSDSLAWFYNLTSLREQGFGDKVDALLDIVKDLDHHISHEELKYFASYVTILAKKPKGIR